ncbi:MAG: polysaccharide deacetylase family protein [Methanomicrobiales archaeon]|nr:polysaccharide deacetylase family protein [Methanomicrobiales archaeon]
MDIYKILQMDTSIWDLFTCKEEYYPQLLDTYGRFPYYASKNRDIFMPKASQYLSEHGFSVEYPDNAPFAVCLTHDIDIIYESIRTKGHSAIRNLKRGNIPESLQGLYSLHSKKIPFCNFIDIMALEEQYNSKSTFFFMAENPEDQDYFYNIEDLGSEIGEIVDRGGEVGLHGGHTTFSDPEKMREKKKKLEKMLNRPVQGYRNHYLRFNVPSTWEYLKEAGFKYDSTLGYADCIGFRNGMCHPFRPFNIDSQSVIDIIEIPLIMMDMTFFNTYMRLNMNQAWELFLRVTQEIERCQGVLTILWHNNNLLNDWRKLYVKILEYCSKKNAWITNGNTICQWWDNEHSRN